MIRMSEMVLPGHPDKFCDQVADAIIAEAVAADPQAYGQVEVAVWSDQVWLSGGLCSRAPLARSLREIVVQVGQDIGYRGANWIDARRYQLHDTVCQMVDDPRRWSQGVNDQAIVVGWAGYDARTAWLAPEHYLAHQLREALTRACHVGPLAGQGPDGKLLLVLNESGPRWVLESVLVTLQQLPDASFMELTARIVQVLRAAYEAVQQHDPRWVAAWPAVQLHINPNGPHTHGGSDGDNGQTGRKLAMDFYGPRVGQGGGALCGKHLTHIDRLASLAARQAAVQAVASGAQEALVRLAYAPNRGEPLEVAWEVQGRGARVPAGFFSFDAMARRYDPKNIDAALARGGHFVDLKRAWNQPLENLEKSL